MIFRWKGQMGTAITVKGVELKENDCMVRFGAGLVSYVRLRIMSGRTINFLLRQSIHDQIMLQQRRSSQADIAQSRAPQKP